jgi:hypothetical protein
MTASAVLRGRSVTYCAASAGVYLGFNTVQVFLQLTYRSLECRYLAIFFFNLRLVLVILQCKGKLTRKARKLSGRKDTPIHL